MEIYHDSGTEPDIFAQSLPWACRRGVVTRHHVRPNRYVPAHITEVSSKREERHSSSSGKFQSPESRGGQTKADLQGRSEPKKRGAWCAIPTILRSRKGRGGRGRLRVQRQLCRSKGAVKKRLTRAHGAWSHDLRTGKKRSVRDLQGSHRPGGRDRASSSRGGFTFRIKDYRVRKVVSKESVDVRTEGQKSHGRRNAYSESRRQSRKESRFSRMDPHCAKKRSRLVRGASWGRTRTRARLGPAPRGKFEWRRLGGGGRVSNSKAKSSRLWKMRTSGKSACSRSKKSSLANLG